MEMDTRNAAEMLALFRPTLAKAEFGDEMLSLIEKLIEERDELLHRQEHIHSLERLVKKTVSDADELAEDIKREAEAEAQNRAKDVLAQAEERAQRVLEEAKAKALADSEQEVRAMRASAEKELENVLKEHKATLRAYLEELGEELYQKTLARAEESKRWLESFQTGLDERFSCVLAAPGQVDAPVVGEDAGVVGATAQEEIAPGSEPEQEALPEPEGEAPALEVESASDGLGEIVEIEILPPRDKHAIEAIRTHLAMQEEVADADICHLTDKTLIQVRLLQPVDLAGMLSRLSQVESAQSVTDAGRSKIEVLLSAHAELERERNTLNTKANRIAARIGRGKFPPR